jgi:hypothetical protein
MMMSDWAATSKAWVLGALRKLAFLILQRPIVFGIKDIDTYTQLQSHDLYASSS